MPHREPPTWQRTFARTMRIEPTESEAELWWALRRRRLGVRFRRQFPIDRYIVDFVCLSHRLVVEVDGSQHAGPADEIRDIVLAREGFAVMRFWTWEVMDALNGVVQQIREELALRERYPPPNDLQSFGSPARGDERYPPPNDLQSFGSPARGELEEG